MPFAKVKSRKRYEKKWYKKNREKLRKYKRDYYLKNKKRIKKLQKIYHKKSYLKMKYGITLEQYKQMSVSQSDLCAICKKFKRLVIDHNHSTDDVRGLLCMTCNSGLGMFKESKEYLESAIAYLDKWN